MKNTLENKQKFFAQYWGQNVLKLSKEISPFVLNDRSRICSESGFLELTPLHLISDEDAIELIGAKEFSLRKNNENSGDFGCSASNIFVNTLNGNNDSYLIDKTNIDYLRSKGYALPYNGLSVEEQVSRGWVVLKTEI